MSFLPPDMLTVLLPLILTYMRVQAIILVLPAFSARILPARLRVGLAMALCPFAAILAPEHHRADDLALLAFAIVALKELFLGVIVALPVRLITFALHTASSAIGATASLSQLIGTGTEAAPHPIGNLFHLAGLALLMALGLPVMLIEMIVHSYLVFPPGFSVDVVLQVHAVVGLVGQSFVLAMALASPFILGGLLYQLLTAVVNRVMPTLPVVFIGAPAIILMALIGLAVLSPGILQIWADTVLGAGALPR
ncbi:flagellar biosynthetic protein FliR [Paracoccus albus]|uniref:flagellar biosynthetic protein FliR n=1 Tax=Paracoccus albus TaxID=3017784 RepID=UPI0022F112D3|nr:flagellar biosynthetic protein FliR [Paracoccus albus]WBU60214.1 flagellar biosynthetic protein FliR [Paracoccus albus]